MFVKRVVIAAVLVIAMLIGLTFRVNAAGLAQTPPMSPDEVLLQIFLQVIVAVAAPLLLCLIGYLIRVWTKRAKAAMSAEQLALVEQVARMYVKAAEQYDLAGKLSHVGAEKKRWVIDQAEAWLARRGIRLDLDILADIIEAAVMELNRGKLADEQAMKALRATLGPLEEADGLN